MGVCLLASANASTTKALPLESARFKRFCQFCLKSQQSMIATLNTVDGGAVFAQNPWDRFDDAGGFVGHGITAVLEGGDLIEKGAASTTFLRGTLSPQRAASMSARLAKKEVAGGAVGAADAPDMVGRSYFAAAFSVVLHSRSPMVPTFRSDVRYFELEGMEGWFGGGADLTPYYLFDEDAHQFHATYRNVCARHGPETLFPRLKKYCDEYFFIPARGEHRGVGGIFFDDLMDTFLDAEHTDDTDDTDVRDADAGIADAGDAGVTAEAGATRESGGSGLDRAMGFTCAVADTFMPSYLTVVDKRRNLPFSDEQRHWQLLRRGRYIEFNLLYDRGVRFGLLPVEQGDRRTEAVLVSCPPLVAWDYNHQPAPGSEEERLLQILKDPRDW
ncbi:Coproporphyrinogen III oxidase [Ochromonadaceae sp. CCMP2298]|nr:Coproporphyrinogen III oxidase [Ochromonadaceae sp. CCMP2298]|eukprot:CAMPEP_0173357134 /NCGR_PEP_ID=MMETSP1144-20121109/18700_1 /TAXON_ID=483371 /ORGANISM="non described non described, Strain CCMP2298" /LENGTH=386 /DNA_ID=CAMNT_0014306017 /DNA_START=109 /DNA_END=1269 /DNA_ORIENTATION=+